MKSILFIAHTISQGGGAERVLQTLIDELSTEYNIDLLEWQDDIISPFKTRIKNVGYLGSISHSNKKAKQEKKSIRFNQIKHFLYAVLNLLLPKVLYKAKIQKKYDYEISFNYLYTSALVAASPNSASKKVMWIHSSVDDLNDKKNFKGIKYFLYRWMQRRALKKANAIVAISKRTHESIDLFYPLISNKIKDVYNGYNFKEIEDKSIDFLVKKSHNFRLISLGRLSSVKNVILQIKAIELLKDKYSINNVELMILGEGEQEDEIIQYAKRNNNIKLIGYQDNPYPYLLSSDALIITSYAEGFPTIAVEAMALGKPVISTPVAGTEELINNQTGIIVEWEANSVAAGIIKIMKNKLSAEVIKESVKGYTKENWANNVSQLLHSLDSK